MKRSTLYTLAAFAALLALMIVLTAGGAKEECRVCMNFRGRVNCATATGGDQPTATENARTTACGPITNGMDDAIACGNTQPASVQCRTR